METKTILEWYEELPLWIKNKAKANLIAAGNDGNVRVFRCDAYEADAMSVGTSDGGFDWDETPEGHEFWGQVYTAFEGDGEYPKRVIESTEPIKLGLREVDGIQQLYDVVSGRLVNWTSIIRHDNDNDISTVNIESVLYNEKGEVIFTPSGNNWE